MAWWSRELSQNAAAQLEDAWGSRRSRSRWLGLIRVKQVALPAVVAASGRSGIFVEAMSWGPPLPETVVRWEPTVVGESACEQLRRLLQQRPRWGLVRGQRQLGVRVEAVPRNWGDDVLISVLAQQTELRSVRILRRQYLGSACTWWFRAAGPADLDCLETPRRAVRSWCLQNHCPLAKTHRPHRKNKRPKANPLGIDLLGQRPWQ